MIKQSITLYKSTKIKPVAQQQPLLAVPPALVDEYVEKAKNSNIAIGNKYRTKYGATVSVEKLGNFGNFVMNTREGPTIVNCQVTTAAGNSTYSCNYTVKDIMDMEPV